MTTVKERPILFSGEMVNAILEGRKTQTRRIVKAPEWWEGHFNFSKSDTQLISRDGGKIKSCPYGKVGGRLWVRETHAIVPRTAYAMSEGVQQILKPNDNHDAAIFRAGWDRSKPGRWRPSIHMPRWASRINLEITDIRVERLQDISGEDSESEGVGFLRDVPDADETLTAKELFMCLWDGINGNWDQNPWVWALTFKVVR